MSGNLEKVKQIAIKAGELILKVYDGSLGVAYKEDQSPVTIADKKANDYIVKELKKLSPGYAVLAEESIDDLVRLKNDWCWIVDPLDGTKEFIEKNGEFTVNIALSYKGEIVMGVIYVPEKKDLYFAVKGKGAFLENLNGIVRLKVSNRTGNLRMLVSKSHCDQKTKDVIKKNGIKSIEGVGSSLKGCLIASGKAEIHYRFGYTMEWDIAAVQCIVEEAGGIMREMDDSIIRYNRENSRNEKGFYILNKIENKLAL